MVHRFVPRQVAPEVELLLRIPGRLGQLRRELLDELVDDGVELVARDGSVPAGGATQWLPVMVGERRAREIILMCEEISAAQALKWGLVNWVVPPAELEAKVDEVVEKLSTKLPQTTRYAKQQLNFWRDLSWNATIGHARDWLSLSMLNEEAQGAIRAFLESRRDN